jgi:hypothetical protein
MSAVAAAKRAAPTARPSALDVFIARAEARALLWQAGELDLHTAVDELWADAKRDGLVAKLGPDKVQELLANAFAPVRDDLAEEEIAAIPAISSADKTFAELCRAADARHADEPLDPDVARMRRLLSDDVSLERAQGELSSDDIPRATLKAADYLFRLGDMARWRKWFDRHSAPERAAILQHLERRNRKRGAS